MLKICSFGAMTGVCKLGLPRFKFLVNLANFNYASFFRQELIGFQKRDLYQPRSIGIMQKLKSQSSS